MFTTSVLSPNCKQFHFFFLFIMLPNTWVMWKEPSSIILVKAKILVWDLSKKLHMNLVSWHCGINPSYLGRRSKIGIAFSTSYKKSHFQAHRWVAHRQEQGVKRQTKHLMMVTNSESFESRVRLVKQNSRHLLTVPLLSESTQHPIVGQTGQSWPVQCFLFIYRVAKGERN